MFAVIGVRNRKRRKGKKRMKLGRKKPGKKKPGRRREFAAISLVLITASLGLEEKAANSIIPKSA